MEFQQLESFVELTKDLSFSKSAKKMHISQSTMSVRIQNLEKELGVVLFNRNGREICLSPYGEILLPYAKQCLSVVQEGMLKIKERKETETKKLRIGVSNPFANLVLPYLLPDIYKAFPDFDIQVLRTERSATLVSMINNSSVDIGFINNIELFEPSETEHLYHAPIFESPLILAMSSSHPLSRNNTIDASMLNEQQFITLNATTTASMLVRSYFEKMKVSPKLNIEINNVRAIFRIVNIEPLSFLTLLPEICLNEIMEKEDIVTAKIAQAPPSLVISLVSLPDKRLTKVIEFITNKAKTIEIAKS